MEPATTADIGGGLLFAQDPGKDDRGKSGFVV